MIIKQTLEAIEKLELRAKEENHNCKKWLNRLDHFTSLLNTDMDAIATTHSLIKLMYATRTDVSITHDALIKTVDATSRGLVQRVRDVNEARMKLYASMGELNRIENELKKQKEILNAAESRVPKVKERKK